MTSKKLTILLALLACNTPATQLFAMDTPRAFVYGLGGDLGIARIDLMVPLFSNCCDRLFYVDYQGKVGTDDGWNNAGGAGFRRIANQRIFGGYLFYDQNFSKDHDRYYVINPGLETIGCRWDFRVNGYLTKHRRTTILQPFPEVIDTCGENINANASFFIGHQQFVRQFAVTKEAGPGVDAELGFHIPGCSNISLYGGGYHYNFRETKDLNGAEARIVVPFNPRVGLTVEASYDNIHHGAVIGGVRLQLGHAPCTPMTLTDHLYDPIHRNIGTVYTGSGIPSVKTTKEVAPALIRDNIWFFSADGSASFIDGNTGTFENPLAPNQFTQLTVDGIDALAPNANLFFNTGTYVINAGSPDAPNSRIALPFGQSLHGRTADFSSSAVGLDRPTFLGGLDLLEGNNTLDSIILINAITDGTGGGASITALNVQDASNVHICNSEIDATTLVAGDLLVGGINNAIALTANNSEIRIDETEFNAQAIVIGTALGFNSAVGIGSISTALDNNNSFDNNIILLNNSTVNARATIGVDLVANGNMAVGIGMVSGTNAIVGLNNEFNNNFFTINNTVISATATIANGALGRAASELNSAIESDNFSIAIGSASFHDNNGANEFNDNIFLINNSSLRSNSTVNASSGSLIDAVGIGSAGGFVSSQIMNNNVFTLNTTSVNAQALVETDVANLSGSIIYSLGIGNLSYNQAANVFSDNTIKINDSIISATSTIGGNVVTGGNNIFAITLGTSSIFAPGTSNFDNNDITIVNSIFNALSNVNGNLANNNRNEAISIGTEPSGSTATFNNNAIDAFDSFFNITALVGGNNAGINKALGFFAGNGTVININDSEVNLTSRVGSGNAPIFSTTETAGTGQVNLNNTVVNIIP